MLGGISHAGRQASIWNGAHWREGANRHPQEGARHIFDLHPGDQLLVLGDEQQGIALVKASQLQQFATDILKAMRGETEE